MPFVLKQFHEQMDKSVKEAKGEVEAFVARKLHETGLAALTQGESPVSLIDKRKED